jgi:hypothetical protein
MNTKALPYKKKSRPLKNNASDATTQYANACTERARKLYQKEKDIEATSFKNINMQEFWAWMESTPSLSSSTKTSYARSVCRVLKITPIKLSNPIKQRSKPTKELFMRIIAELDLPLGSYISNDSNNALYVFILMATTGVNISSGLRFTVASEININGHAMSNYDLSIETINRSLKKNTIELHEVPWNFRGMIKSGIEYLNRLNKKLKSEVKKTMARVRYFIQKKLLNHGHTITSSRRSFPSILGYLK